MIINILTIKFDSCMTSERSNIYRNSDIPKHSTPAGVE